MTREVEKGVAVRDATTGRFVKGTGGRPKGAKSKQTKKFQQEVYNNWEKNGNGSLVFLQQMADGTHPLLAEMTAAAAAKQQLDCIKQLMKFVLEATVTDDDDKDDLKVMSPAEARQALVDAKKELNDLSSINGFLSEEGK